MTGPHNHIVDGAVGELDWGAANRVIVGGGQAYADLIENLRQLQNGLADAHLDEQEAADINAQLTEIVQTVQSNRFTRDRPRQYGRRHDLIGRAQTYVPAFTLDSQTDSEVRGSVTFGSYYHGDGGALHGGTVPLLFDEVLGHLCHRGGRKPARTAFIKADFRSITPLNKQLIIEGQIDRIEGRKRFVSGRLLDGDRLCAEVTALFVELLPGQR